MPKIPLYGDGQGPVTQLATGPLGVRARSDVLTAPARAFAKSTENLGQISFNLGMAERDRQDKTILKEEQRAAQEYFVEKRIQDQNTTIKGADESFTQHRASYMESLQGKGYDRRRMALVKDAVDGIYVQQSLSAKATAFDRGTKLATETDNETLDMNLQIMRSSDSSSPEYLRARQQNNEIFANAKSENRTLKYTPKTLEVQHATDIFNLQLEGARTPAEVDAAYQEFIGKGYILPSKKLEAKNIRNNAKKKLGDTLYDATREQVVEGDFSPSELEQINDGYTKGNDFTITRDNGEVQSFSVSDMRIEHRLSIADMADKLRDDSNNAIRAGMISDITDGFDGAGSDGAISIASEAVRTAEDKEQADEAILGSARRFATDAKVAYARGDLSAAVEYANIAESLLTEQFQQRPSLIENAGALGTSANTIRGSIADIRIKIKDDKDELVLLRGGVSAMERGVYDNLGGVYTNSQEKKMLNMVMSDKSLAEQLEILEQNNLRYDPIYSTINGGATEGLGATPDMNEVMQGLELFRQLKIRGTGVLANNSDEQSRAFYNAVLSMEATGKSTVDAITKVNIAFNSGIDITPKYNTIKTAVDGLLDSQTMSVFGFTIMGDRVTNRSYVHDRIKNLAGIYIGLGIDPSESVTLAGEDLNQSHMNLRGNYIPRSRSYPQDLELMADLVAKDYVSKNPDLDEDDVSIIPVQGRADEWIVTVNGVAGTSSYSIDDLMGLRDLAKVRTTQDIVKEAERKKKEREKVKIVRPGLGIEVDITEEVR